MIVPGLWRHGLTLTWKSLCICMLSVIIKREINTLILHAITKS